ncbi:hypothetical protein AQUCO_02500376v1 [Aquilegia coerulea]|uniref:Uncharacterized protein n=1 Tax=Aquilegia coerulea TaxID=218851 RepID=A0A2G5DAY9_AQUCA|nr:hypothetical protein AQUCO_02500376v1 [Aquilegia coerulea]
MYPLKLSGVLTSRLRRQGNYSLLFNNNRRINAELIDMPSFILKLKAKQITFLNAFGRMERKLHLLPLKRDKQTRGVHFIGSHMEKKCSRSIFKKKTTTNKDKNNKNKIKNRLNIALRTH